MAWESEYKLEDVAASSVAAENIDDTFKSNYIDLISAALGGTVLSYSDQWFAEASNLLTPAAPIRQPGKMVYSGAWYDGWETRRHNPAPFDYVVIRLGVASGTVAGVEVDTAFFSGNEAPAISVEGCFLGGSEDGDQEAVGWGAGRGRWETILGTQACGPSRRQAWVLRDSSSTAAATATARGQRAYTHVRLNMYPDGGIARFRLFGRAVPVFPADPRALLDLAAAQSGGLAVSCSDQHFGTRANLLLPGRGRDMGDGWETARSRHRGHEDWAVVRLGAEGAIVRVVVDTAHFRGNFPQRVRVLGLRWGGEEGKDPEAEDEGWKDVVEEIRTGPDKEHEVESIIPGETFTHVKLVIIPDGGVKRLRIIGKRQV